MDGLQFYIQLLWMMDDLQFTSFLTDFQSYQADRRVIIKAWCNGIPVTVERFPSVVGFEPKTATIYHVKLMHHYLKFFKFLRMFITK